MTSTDIGLDLSRYKLGWADEENYVFKPKSKEAWLTMFGAA